MRQRDEGGTKKWNFLVERWAPGWIIVDWTIQKDPGAFGTYTWPNGSIVSSSGNASIVSETRSERQRLSELRNEVQGKAMGCYGPVCGELQQKAQSLDREIQRLSEIERTAISAGGNEKVMFRGTTYVDCSKILGIQNCGGGAKANGKILVNQRFIGTPQTAIAPSLALTEETRSTLQRYEASKVETPPTQQQRPIEPASRPESDPPASAETSPTKTKKECKRIYKKAKKKCGLSGQECVNRILAANNCPAR